MKIHSEPGDLPNVGDLVLVFDAPHDDWYEGRLIDIDDKGRSVWQTSDCVLYNAPWIDRCDLPYPDDEVLAATRAANS